MTFLDKPTEITPGVFKPLGDCTAEDLKAAADLAGAAAGLEGSVAAALRELAAATDDGTAEILGLTPAETARVEKMARDFVAADIGDTAPAGSITVRYKQALQDLYSLPGHHHGCVLIETASIAGEAVIRLAATRGEDPQETWQWLLATWPAAAPVQVP